MQGRIVAGRHKGVDLDRLDVRTLSAFSATSTRKAARYWWRILTARSRLE